MSYDVAGFTFATYFPITHYGWSSAAVSAMFIVAGGVSTCFAPRDSTTEAIGVPPCYVQHHQGALRMPARAF